jgi:hypothetical protein
MSISSSSGSGGLCSAAYSSPIKAPIALLTYAIRRDVLCTAILLAVLSSRVVRVRYRSAYFARLLLCDRPSSRLILNRALAPFSGYLSL